MLLSAEQTKGIKQEVGYLNHAKVKMQLFDSGEKNERGFTLVELITIIIIIGIIGVAAIPRFVDRGTFDSQGFHDQVISTLRYAQKAAISQRRFVCVVIANNAVTLTYDATPPGAGHTVASCPGSPLANPATGVAPVSTSTGVTVTAATFNFDALGRPSAPQSITVNGNAPITVEAETGYVH